MIRLVEKCSTSALSQPDFRVQQISRNALASGSRADRHSKPDARRDDSWTPPGDNTVPQTNPTRQRAQGVTMASLARRVGVIKGNRDAVGNKEVSHEQEICGSARQATSLATGIAPQQDLRMSKSSGRTSARGA